MGTVAFLFKPYGITIQLSGNESVSVTLKKKGGGGGGGGCGERLLFFLVLVHVLALLLSS